MSIAKGATLNHISRESSDVRRLADFYQEIFGFEEMKAPDFGDFKVIWLNLPGAFALHLIERSHVTKLPEGPYSATSAVADPSHLPRGHHICFSVSNFDSFVNSLKLFYVKHVWMVFGHAGEGNPDLPEIPTRWQGQTNLLLRSGW
ncbi:hypothetical protein Dsin_029622 [Dipteronia sinensis]|uniref:VOC domain-containing protein n=1 Tax=Dipteronia sinensis TaxID=43782 RepID=A0AAE0DVN5_9ROSI|nr:hypothetical protein Dsin_029622 [Dipteronia sinensis]